MGKVPLGPVEFAVIKEYMEVGGSDEGIAKVTGLTEYAIDKIRTAPSYKNYLDDLKHTHKIKTSRPLTKEETEWDSLRKKWLAKEKQ